MAAENDMLSRARRFAAALDAERYEEVGALLASDCSYLARGRTLSGPDAIVASYQTQGESARRLFDQVEYDSQVRQVGADAARIVFADRLRKGGEVHVFCCQQTLRFNARGQIVQITHQELAGEREGLLDFCAGCGVSLDGGEAPDAS